MEVSAIVHPRITIDEVCSEAASALLEIDEAVEVLEEMNVKEITQEQEAIVKNRAARKGFEEEFSAKARSVYSH